MARLVAKTLRTPLRWLGGGLEAVLAKMTRPPVLPPLFLVGPSRSGSTLLSQAMVYAMDVGYIRNSMMSSSRYPLCRCRASLGRYGRARPSDFQSKYGITDGPTGVSTASDMWLRAFRDDAGQLHSQLPDEHQGRLVVQVIGMVSRYYRAPLVTKWTGNAARVTATASLFPQAVFLRVRRDHLDVVQSMLNARRSSHGDPYKRLISWPADFDQPNTTHYTEQICEHLFRIESAIDRAAQELDDRQIIEVKYEAFCANPNAEIARIGDEYAQRTGQEMTVLRQLPNSFACSHGQKVTDEEYQAFKTHLRQRHLDFVEQKQ